MCKFCSGKLEWVEGRGSLWSSDYIWVGVVGVTSSGKSTLINAIFGADVLSSAVAPSSGQLVFCAYGRSASAVIRFEDKPYKVLSGKNYSKAQLEKCSDERSKECLWQGIDPCITDDKH